MDFIAELVFGLELTQLTQGFVEGIFGFAGVALNPGVFGFVLVVEERVDLRIILMESGGGEAAAFEVPGGFEGAFEDGFLKRAGGLLDELRCVMVCPILALSICLCKSWQLASLLSPPSSPSCSRLCLVLINRSPGRALMDNTLREAHPCCLSSWSRRGASSLVCQGPRGLADPACAPP